MRSRETFLRRAATLIVLAPILGLAAAPTTALGASGFGPLRGPNGCLVAPGMASSDKARHSESPHTVFGAHGEAHIAGARVGVGDCPMHVRLPARRALAPAGDNQQQAHVISSR